MTNPADNALVAAAQWLADVSTGSIAVGVATIAVAGIGFGMLAGRVDLRRGATVILGCFILFAAPSLAATVVQWTSVGEAAPQLAVVAPPNQPVPEPPPLKVNDPYAGASLIR
jgi:type IV secretory pathway VirB2 component (pilin)